MEIIVNVPAERLEFALEVLRNLAFVESARPKRAAKVKSVEMDTTDYLLSNPANATNLRESIAQLRRGQTVPFELPAE
ncbi:hypothetical protein ACFP2F_08095 [Hymenobacter artigasi]|uniref:Antitoxin n=1 Tax=Hymenobacter artigasi TaxID=2719616 RepID=A0ABX1HG34_9BACT|nr:hypothetical protein [Hymenobacter artigasi]NKI89214.1 hypothetical protein [Hymenobacter artigasi]